MRVCLCVLTRIRTLARQNTAPGRQGARNQQAETIMEASVGARCHVYEKKRGTRVELPLDFRLEPAIVSDTRRATAARGTCVAAPLRLACTGKIFQPSENFLFDSIWQVAKSTNTTVTQS